MKQKETDNDEFRTSAESKPFIPVGGVSKGRVGVKRRSASTKDSSFSWWFSLIMLTVVSFVTRMYEIHIPDIISWDEAHFAKYGSFYIKGIIFFDVHPPLGKMLVALSGVLNGYDGNYAFDTSDIAYTAAIPYAAMRSFCALFGCALVPLFFCITWILSRSLHASILAATLIICDTGTLTLSRFILLDQFLLFFIASSTFCYLKFLSHSSRSFSVCWWLWLSLTGLSLSCAVSVKFVGLFVILLVGVSTAGELWRLVWNLSLTMRTVLNHLLARIMCLVLLPVIMYIIFFCVHLCILTKSGAEDNYFSSVYQSHLEGNPLHNISMPINAAFGSVIRLRNSRIRGMYLHSHEHAYPEGFGPSQQQVTGYEVPDPNTQWVIKRPLDDGDEGDEIQLLRNGDQLRLQHLLTGCNVHSHRVLGALTKAHYHVSCYGHNGTGDENDIFRLVVPGRPVGELVTALRSTFFLMHKEIHCALYVQEKQLPEWGLFHRELTCTPVGTHPDNLWNIEYVIDSRLKNESVETVQLSLLEKFVEFHSVIFTGSKALKPRDGENITVPWHWPINKQGNWFATIRWKVYLLGNPVIWWSSLATSIISCIYSVVNILVQRRMAAKNAAAENGNEEEYTLSYYWLLLAWSFHYLPFWCMCRILYFHHYFPALMFALAHTAIIWDNAIVGISSRFREPRRTWVYHTIVATVYSVIIFSFVEFSPLAYGMDSSAPLNEASPYNRLKWLDTWEFNSFSGG